MMRYHIFLCLHPPLLTRSDRKLQVAQVERVEIHVETVDRWMDLMDLFRSYRPLYTLSLGYL